LLGHGSDANYSYPATKHQDENPNQSPSAFHKSLYPWFKPFIDGIKSTFFRATKKGAPAFANTPSIIGFVSFFSFACS
jgi:hypothetical protein